jgi:GT2 family glycosyltransferase
MPATVIVPVHDGVADLERCLAALARHRPPGGLIVFDDASRDPRITPLLSRFAAANPGTRLARAEANGGFIAACNAAARLAPAGDDLLFLNSDTEVTAGAFDEMERVLDRTGAAICCPMSSNATFLSVPRYQQPNELPAGWNADDMAIAVREAAADGFAAPIPTPVGFCMQVRRSAWERWGPFDPAYGMGYGEEDELGQRVQAGGGRIVAAMRAYVWHRGGASFGESDATRERRRVNGQLLSSRWPMYAETVRTFAQANPFRPMLERLWHRVLSAPERRERHVLHLVPRWETQGALRERVLGAARAARSSANHTIVVPTPDRGAWLDAIDGESEAGIRVVGLIDMPARLSRFLAAGVATEVHVHASSEWESAPLAQIARAAGRPVLLD